MANKRTQKHMNMTQGNYITKRYFDPTVREDLLAFKHFMRTRSWGKDGCPFALEWPWLSIPDMITHKVAEHYVNKVMNSRD